MQNSSRNLSRPLTTDPHKTPYQRLPPRKNRPAPMLEFGAVNSFDHTSLSPQEIPETPPAIVSVPIWISGETEIVASWIPPGSPRTHSAVGNRMSRVTLPSTELLTCSWTRDHST